MGQKSLTASDHESRMEGAGLLKTPGVGVGNLSSSGGTVPAWENNYYSLSVSVFYLAKLTVLRHLFTVLGCCDSTSHSASAGCPWVVTLVCGASSMG